MNEKLRVIIDNKQNVMKIPTGVRMLVRRCCKAVLANENFTDSAEISVTFVDDETIHELNKKHRNIDKSTDVQLILNADEPISASLKSKNKQFKEFKKINHQPKNILIINHIHSNN